MKNIYKIKASMRVKTLTLLWTYLTISLIVSIKIVLVFNDLLIGLVFGIAIMLILSLLLDYWHN